MRPVSDLPAFDRPAPMEGHGVYNRSSRVQAAGLAPAVPLLEQAARTVPLTAAAQPTLLLGPSTHTEPHTRPYLVDRVFHIRPRLDLFALLRPAPAGFCTFCSRSALFHSFVHVFAFTARPVHLLPCTVAHPSFPFVGHLYVPWPLRVLVAHAVLCR